MDDEQVQQIMEQEQRSERAVKELAEALIAFGYDSQDVYYELADFLERLDAKDQKRMHDRYGVFYDLLFPRAR